MFAPIFHFPSKALSVASSRPPPKLINAQAQSITWFSLSGSSSSTACLVISVRGLYGKALERLRELDRGGVIRFPEVFRKLCTTFSITKEECWEVLFALRDAGLIEIVPYQGVRLKRKRR